MKITLVKLIFEYMAKNRKAITKQLKRERTLYFKFSIERLFQKAFYMITLFAGVFYIAAGIIISQIYLQQKVIESFVFLFCSLLLGLFILNNLTKQGEDISQVKIA